ncbi:XkdF-like putative serine protease domain-containing protein [Aneurinibacillus migulanus]|uniref:Putative phage serine protease XkdF n=1 Tax=Aneurinibacillus migulanus TaxID=47500 RepID=A0A0D1Y761_ANEMI|nr:XkdF-like putative serine protease domain-containing protein [Aneurinibacillus migulanus]KIV60288.1 hypothetical protein TS65_00435 [Aneurinibacillus migulanus]KON90513.1 hypothetical protein AF333_28970 [Aneurinibacillus migulanus]MED0894904.1 XkdF-like putative serine protease domain-containing protein [Aneurinibacillus migulanus]MED1614453.1 XkdF-like putative serine protease domain-containing protein [Aneurinibacillus migulanus]SDJ77272.1 Putative phage serine protease XkdF [Aneurinibac
MPRELTNVDVTHVSYVDSAANKRKFFLTKSAEQPTWQKEVKLLTKADDEQMLVYGVVYEPSSEDELILDTHDEYMTAQEIEKAAHGFMMKAQNIDTQHDFSSGAGQVVESYIAPADFEVSGEVIRKGSWVLVTKATQEIWDGIKNGEYTGYSLAGTATIIQKGGEKKVEKEKKNIEQEKVLTKSDDEVKGFFNVVKQFFLNRESVAKGMVADTYNAQTKRDQFWNAMHAFETVVRRYNWQTDKYEFVEDEQTIREAITDLTTILNEVLLSDNIMKSIGEPPDKVQKEEEEVTKEEAAQITKSIDELTVLVKAQGEKLAELEKGSEKTEEVEKKAEEAGEKATEVEKAQEEAVTTISKQLEELTSLVKTQGERLEVVEKARGITKAADNDEHSEEQVQKSTFGSLFMRSHR